MLRSFIVKVIATENAFSSAIRSEQRDNWVRAMTGNSKFNGGAMSRKQKIFNDSGCGFSGSTKSLSLSGGKRKSAFLPYKPTTKVLTNLQRGNTEANIQTEICLSFHERAGQGEITEEQARQQPVIDAVDKSHFTALHWACFYGQLCSVRILVKFGANVSTLAPDLVSPLLLAAAGGHHEIVRFLLQHGADQNHMDVMGNTALMYAAAGNYPHTCNELLSFNPNIFRTNENEETAYSLALKNNANLSQAVLENYIVSLLTS